MSSTRALDHHPRPHDHPEHPDHNLRNKAFSRLKIAFLISLGLIVAEVLGAYFSGSLALLADAFHVISDAIALGITLLSAWLATRPRTPRKSYGYYRLEILAALFNGLLLLVLAVGILKEAYLRFQNPTEIDAGIMLPVAFIGLLVNFLMLWILHSSKTHNLNLKGAYLHILGDTLASVAVVGGALGIFLTGLTWLDSVASAFVAILIFSMALRLTLDAIHVLLEGTPKHMDPGSIEQELKENFKNIKSIHDFHIWEITSHLFAMTAHIQADVKTLEDTGNLIDQINDYIRNKYGIGHTTFQVEPNANE